LLAQPLDWSFIQKRADFHGVAPLIYHHLKKLQNNPIPKSPDESGATGQANPSSLSALGFEPSATPGHLSPVTYHLSPKLTQSPNNVIPSPVLEFFRQAYYENLARNLTLFQELKKILKALNNHGIKVVVLKGAALAETIYGNPALRPLSDLDLLIRKQDLAEAERELLDSGYSPIKIEFLGWWAEKFGGERLYVKRADFPMYVDIHWNIATPSAKLDSDRRHAEIDRIWNEARPMKVAGVDTMSMSVEDIILHTSAHLAAHHLQFRLIWLKDIYELTHQYQGQINWEKIVENARYLKLGGPIYSCFKCAKESLDAPIPEEVLPELKSSYSNSLETKVHNFLLSMDGDRTDIAEHFYHYLSIPGIGNKGLFLFGAMFPSIAYMRNRYSIPMSKLVYLYYLYRPCNIFYQASLTLFRLMWLLITKKIRSKKLPVGYKNKSNRASKAQRV